MDSNIGKMLDGRYELLELIGTGGMANVYRANDVVENRDVAVKILRNEFADSEEFQRRFRNESKAIAVLSHPNIVKIYDVGFTDKVQFIVMEYVDGITMADYIEQQGVLKWQDAVYFTMQMLKALQNAHDNGIVHRDVKSSNVMLMRDGKIKMMDFGIASFNRESSKTVSDKTIGSVHYISPEQARGDLTDERSDIYSTGVVLYEMITGKKPFDGDTPVQIALMHMQSTAKKPSELNSTIPEGLEQIVLHAMQKEPSARYQTAGEMIKDLEELRTNPGIVFEYKYNSTDGSTKYFDRPAAAAAVAPSKGKPAKTKKVPVYEEPEDDEDEYEDDDDEVEERRSPLIPILFAVGTAFIIATMFLVVTLVNQKLGITESDITSVFNPNASQSDTLSVNDYDEIQMPDLLGMNFLDAQEQYPQIKLVAQQEWSEEEKDTIFWQQYPGSRRVKVGTEVTVKVSKGIRQVEIQDLTDRTVAAAEQQLAKDGFKVKKVYQENDEVTKDYVIRTEPAAHEMAPQGSTVVLFVSYGPKETAVNVINFVSLPKETAIERCNELHLTPLIELVDMEEDEGKVIEQSIEPGSIVERNTEITLKVSTGKIPEKTATIRLTLPSKAKGEFVFKYYVDGILDEERSDEKREISLSANKTIKYPVTGRPGETKQIAIMVTSSATGKTGTYYEVEVSFAEDEEGEDTITTISKNSKVFEELLDGAPIEPSPVETVEPEGEPSDPDDTSDTSSDTSSEPEHTTSNPAENVEPNSGIAVG